MEKQKRLLFKRVKLRRNHPQRKRMEDSLENFVEDQKNPKSKLTELTLTKM
jgi:hypothetical protein